jgi:hypothetical protein
LDNLQTLQKKIRKKLNDLSVQVINIPMLYWDTTGNVDIYVIRNTKLDELVNKIKKRFNCCMSGQCAYDHSEEFVDIYYGCDKHEGNYILSRSQDFHDFEDDLDLFSYLVGYNGLWLQFASDKLKLNRKLILKATNNTLSAVMYIPIKLPSYNLTNQFNKIWDDTKIINKCIKFFDYDTFGHVSFRIRSIPKYAKQFVKKVPKHIIHVSPEISNYRELCLIAVRKRPIYQYISEKMRDDLEIVKTVIKNGYIQDILMIKKHLFNKVDYELVKQCITKQCLTEPYYESLENTIYDHLPYQLRADITLALIGVQRCHFKSIQVKLRQNPDIINIYLRRPSYISTNRTIIPSRTLQRFEFYKKLCRTRLELDAYSKLSKKYQENRNFVLETVKNERDVPGLPNKYLDDEEIVSHILKVQPTWYEYISIRLQKLKYLAMLVLNHDRCGYLMYPYISNNLKLDPDIIIETLNHSPRSHKSPDYILNLRNMIKDRPEIVGHLDMLIDANSELIKNLFKDNEKRKQLLSINGSFISKYKVGDNIELMAIAVRQNSDNIRFIKPKYRDIVLKLVN